MFTNGLHNAKTSMHWATIRRTLELKHNHSSVWIYWHSYCSDPCKPVEKIITILFLFFYPSGKDKKKIDNMETTVKKNTEQYMITDDYKNASAEKAKTHWVWTC